MTETDKPIVDIPTLRRDLYLVMGLLLADREIAKAPGMTDWTQAFYDNEVRRLMLWVAAAMRSLLDHKEVSFGKARCGEYWPDFPNRAEEPLAFRQACNSVIHARDILSYKAPHPSQEGSETNIARIYTNRMTVRGIHKGKNTRAHVDIIRFVRIANSVISAF